MGWVVWFGVAWGQDVPASTVTVTLAEAVARSAAVASITGADASERVAESRKDQAGAGRMPSIGVSGSVNVWNAEQVVSLLPSDAPLDCSVFPAEFAGLCEGFGEPLVVRNQVTATLTARAGIPLTGQFAIDRRIKAADAGVDAAHAQGLSARVDARYQAEEAWFVALQAESQLAIAEAQVQSLGERVHSAQVGFDQGAATRNDVLKAELALARAEQAVIQVRTLRDAAYGRLGLATASGGVPARPIGDPPPPPEPEVEIEALVSRAVEARPELAALRAQVRAADEAARAASLDRLPQVGAVAAYVHTEGQGTFAEPDAAYVGATLDWSLWAGGARTAALGGARASADVLRSQLASAEAQIRVEVKAKADALAAAIAGWKVADRSIAQAEENLRIQDTIRGAGSGTMTDLLDAEAALVEARSRTAGALYDAHRAAAALERAIGGDGTTTSTGERR